MKILTEQDLQQAYLNLVRDAEVDRLELALQEPNIFSILGVGHMEIRHSNFLGWLLNPRESHGLNDLFLKRFLREIFFDGKIKELQPLDAERLEYQKVEIKREWRSIDLLIKFPDLVICIENKIWSKDHSNQLTRYKETIKAEFPDSDFINFKKVFVYLTPFGSNSSTEQETYAFISYKHIIQILERIITIHKTFMSQQSFIYIQDYITSLKRNLMGNDSTNNLAKDIYRNHKKLIDFIYANRPNAAEEYTEVGREIIQKENYILGSEHSNFVRFLSPSLIGLIPIYKKNYGWIKGEAPLFEIEFRQYDVMLKITAQPAEDERYRERLKDLLSPEFKNIKDWERWFVFYHDRINITYKDAKLDKQMVENEIRVLLNKLKPSIQKVEEILLQNQEELKALKFNIENQSE